MSESKVVLITGASRGLGKSIALDCAKQGYEVWMTYQSSDEKAKATLEEVQATGASARLFKFDVRDGASVKEALAPALEEKVPFGVVNNAGITRDGLMIRMNNEQWDDVVDTALKGFFNVTQAVLPLMLKKRTGRIIAISSVVGITGNPGQVNYASAKAGLIGAIKALSQEVARRGILCNCIAPGFIDTEMTEALDSKEILKKIPLARMGKPEDIAGGVRFLLGEDSSYITGQTLSINGGMA